MIDCGEGTQMQCKRYNVKLSRIDHILISHLHGDHYYGLIGLLSTMHLYGRQKELILIGPPGLLEILTLQLRYSETTLNFKIKMIEWVPGERQLVFENTRVTIETIPLDHRVPCSGYLFREKPKSRRINKAVVVEKLTPDAVIKLKKGEDLINEDGELLYENSKATLPPLKPYSYAYCSDTRISTGILDLVKDTDILYHEATFMDEMSDRAYNTYHTTARQAAEFAKEAQCKLLLIGHFSTRYKNLDPVLEEAKEVFDMTYLATEGQIFVPIKQDFDGSPKEK